MICWCLQVVSRHVHCDIHTCSGSCDCKAGYYGPLCEVRCSSEGTGANCQNGHCSAEGRCECPRGFQSVPTGCSRIGPPPALPSSYDVLGCGGGAPASGVHPICVVRDEATQMLAVERDPGTALEPQPEPSSVALYIQGAAPRPTAVHRVGGGPQKEHHDLGWPDRSGGLERGTVECPDPGHPYTPLHNHTQPGRLRKAQLCACHRANHMTSAEKIFPVRVHEANKKMFAKIFRAFEHFQDLQ